QGACLVATTRQPAQFWRGQLFPDTVAAQHEGLSHAQDRATVLDLGRLRPAEPAQQLVLVGVARQLFRRDFAALQLELREAVVLGAVEAVPSLETIEA